ncbi:hypothetical protein CLNEO_17220 [Anaerotignum neopropionicum]|uniref:Uncharacterized protein n=1 Tax=Anaerotignum neopropionicum TaxID=36847 RepID=A0A136WE06_9FIRM|nr:hypothetical protein [Anaerotignum neopropionicum]KXL52701.1 hypothetical protein CLNEO_17220 [Anaerotignum neopropionicum]
MTYQCKLMDKECDGCGDCHEEAEPCPNCGSQEYEVQYFLKNEWIGCDQCIKRRFP